MNKSQKILTLVFLALFAATLIWFPHEKYPETLYYFVLFDYDLPPDWFKAYIEWMALTVFYTALFQTVPLPDFELCSTASFYFDGISDTCTTRKFLNQKKFIVWLSEICATAARRDAKKRCPRRIYPSHQDRKSVV